MKTNFNNISSSKLKDEQLNIKTYLLDVYGNNILKDKYTVCQWTFFSDIDKIEDSKFNVDYYEPNFTIDDGEPFYQIKNLDINDLIEFISLNLKCFPSIDFQTDGNADPYWDLVNYHKGLEKIENSFRKDGGAKINKTESIY